MYMVLQDIKHFGVETHTWNAQFDNVLFASVQAKYSEE